MNLRYPREIRDLLENLRLLPMVTLSGAVIPLRDVARVEITEGPNMIRSENARINGWVYVDIAGRDLGSYVKEAQKMVTQRHHIAIWLFSFVVWPVRIFRARCRAFRNCCAARCADRIDCHYFIIILTTLLLSLVGGIWLSYFLGYHLSVAVVVGFIVLAGVVVEIGVVMLVYLNQAYAKYKDEADAEKRALTLHDLQSAIIDGALLRLRPIMMTVSAIIGGLLPIMFFGGTGSEVMRCIAAPMADGMISATLLTLIVIPAVFLLWMQLTLPHQEYE